MDLTSFADRHSFTVQCCRWGVQVILTDTTQVWLDLRKELQGMHALWLVTCVCSLSPEDYNKETEFGRLFLFLSPVYYSPLQMGIGILQKRFLERIAGPFEKVSMDQATAIVPTPPNVVPPPPALTATAA